MLLNYKEKWGKRTISKIYIQLTIDLHFQYGQISNPIEIEQTAISVLSI